MARSSLTAVVLLVVSIVISAGQSTGQPGYMFLDTPRLGSRDLLKESTSPGMAHIAAVRKKLSAAGEDGNAFQLMSCRGVSLGILLKRDLKRDGLGPRTYQVLAAGDQNELLKALNEAASSGFRLVPRGAKIFSRTGKRWTDRWMAVVTKVPTEERFTYTRAPDRVGRVAYSTVELGRNGDGELCARAEADGYRAVVRIDDFVVVERPARSTTPPRRAEPPSVITNLAATSSITMYAPR